MASIPKKFKKHRKKHATPAKTPSALPSIDQLLKGSDPELLSRINFVPAVNSAAQSISSHFKPINQVDAVSVVNPSRLVSDEAEDVNSDGFRMSRYFLFPPHRLRDLQKWTAPRRIGSGLINLGNTCFLNSVLQALIHTPGFFNYLATKEHSKSCLILLGCLFHSAFVCGQGRSSLNCLFCEFEELIDKSSKYKNAFPPNKIVSQLRLVNRRFHVGRQEDAHEFLRFLLDCLDRNWIRSYGKIRDVRVQETSFISSLFGGYLRSQIKCTECGHCSNTFDAMLDLSLEVLKMRTLEKALKRFISPDILDGDNKYRCDGCRKKVIAIKRFTVYHPPPVLTIQLKRFQFTYMLGKIRNHIEFPLNLDLKPCLSHPERCTYSLCAVVVHHGPFANSGHYVCYAKSAAGIWHCLNDSMSQQVKAETVLQQKAYILFYVRDSLPDLPMPRKQNAVESKLLSPRSMSDSESEESEAESEAQSLEFFDEDEDYDDDDDEFDLFRFVPDSPIPKRRKTSSVSPAMSRIFQLKTSPFKASYLLRANCFGSPLRRLPVSTISEEVDDVDDDMEEMKDLTVPFSFDFDSDSGGDDNAWRNVDADDLQEKARLEKVQVGFKPKRRYGRDKWDSELDFGRTKKIKEFKPDLFAETRLKGNRFQQHSAWKRKH